MKFCFTKNPESESFYKESKSNKKILAGGRGGVEVWLGSVIFFAG